MKKFFAISAMAVVTMSFISCEKDDKKNDGNGDGSVKIEREWRVKTMSGYTYNYNSDGKVASVVSKDDNRVFEYSGNKLTIKDNDVIEYTMTLNNKGFATAVENADHKWAIEYDADGYMIKGTKDGVQCTSQSISDGNILYWTRFDDKNNFWRMKDATYLDKLNIGCIQTHWAEDLGFKRWAWEARLFGNTSVNLMEACVWHNFGDVMAEKTAVYTYEYDANGLVTKETKYYGVWNETDTTGMDKDNEVTFTLEKIKK